MAKKQAQEKINVKEQDVAANIPDEKDNTLDKPVDNVVDKQAFVNRKLSILNKKSGALQERNAARIVKNNR